jgi:HK97 family phage major capsid protein
VQDAPPDTEYPNVEQKQILEDAHGGAQMDESMKSEIAEVVKGVLAEVLPAKEEPVGATMKAAPAIKKVTEMGFSDEPVKALMQYLKKGDRDAAKAALQEDTAAEGGYMVPDDFYARVVEKRNPASWIRQAPVTIIPTSLQKVVIPAEDTAATKFVATAEEGSVDENEPTFAGTALEVHKLTKLVKVSEELLADAKVNLDAYFASMFGRALALAENYYCTIGTGTGMPQGIVAGATASGITTAAAAAITATEMASLFGTLGAGYNVPGEVRLWMKNASLWYLRGLTGNPFQFWQNPGGDAFGILGAQVHVADDMDAITNSGKSVLVGNATFYAVAERQQLTVRRLTELYAANGQVGILATVRMGGVVTQSEAFKYLTQHS